MSASERTEALPNATHPSSDGNRSLPLLEGPYGATAKATGTSSSSSTGFRYIAEAPTQSTAGSSEDDDDEERVEEPESFWNEWAEELLQKEECEYQVRLSLSPQQVQNEASVYEDPSFSVVEETPNNSCVMDGEDWNALTDAAKTPVLTYPPSLLHTNDNVDSEDEGNEQDDEGKAHSNEEVEDEKEETATEPSSSPDKPSKCPDESRCFADVNTSMSTVAAMNISQATIQLPVATLLQQAMDYSNQATDLVPQKEYTQAMQLFQQAVDCYHQSGCSTNNNTTTSKPSRSSILTLVNIAGCYRNMGTVARLLETFDEAAQYLKTAEEYYIQGREAVEIKSSEAILTLDGKLLDEDHSHTVDTMSPTTANSYYTIAEDETMSLDSMVIETLQSRAHFYVKYQDDREQAVECHEQCLKHLIHLAKGNRWEEENSEEPVREQGVAFVPISKVHHTALLVKSLESLGDLYRSLVASNDASMVLFEDALDILQCRLEQEEPANDALIQSVSLILRYLSEVYFARHALDQAVDALHDSTAVKLTLSGPPCPEALAVMDQMGAAHEQMEHFDKALSCFEQTLLARCKYYGTTHFCVAQSLVHVARVTERRDGPTSPESIELYKAANAIFALHLCTDRPVPLDHEVEQVLQLIPTVIQQGRFEKAISDLNMCLAMADNEKTTIQFNKAQLYFDLGRAYMGMQDYKLATAALTKALQQPENAFEEEIYDLLQRVEFLQREGETAALDGGASRMAQMSHLVPDPTMSFHDLSLQTERSLYIFQDGVEKRTGNPHYDILYHSFVKEAEPAKAAEVPATSLRRTDPPHRTPKTIKIGQHVALLIQRIQSSQKIRKLRNFRIHSVFKVCQGKPSVVEFPTSPRDVVQYDLLTSEEGTVDPKEVIAYSSFEMPPPSKIELALSRIALFHRATPSSNNNATSHHRSSRMRNVIIAEEEGGFGCQLA